MKNFILMKLACLLPAICASVLVSAQTSREYSIATLVSGDWVAIARVDGPPTPVIRPVSNRKTGELIRYDRLISQSVVILDATGETARSSSVLLRDDRFRPGSSRPALPPTGLKVGETYLLVGSTGTQGAVITRSAMWQCGLGQGQESLPVLAGEAAIEWLSPTKLTRLVPFGSPATTYLATRAESLQLGGDEAVEDAAFFVTVSARPSFLPEFEGKTLKEWLGPAVGKPALELALDSQGSDAVVLGACAASAGAVGGTKALLRAIDSYVAQGGAMTMRLGMLLGATTLSPTEASGDELVYLASMPTYARFRHFFLIHSYPPRTEQGVADLVSMLGAGGGPEEKLVLYLLSDVSHRADLSPYAPQPLDRPALVKFWKDHRAAEILAMGTRKS